MDPKLVKVPVIPEHPRSRGNSQIAAGCRFDFPLADSTAEAFPQNKSSNTGKRTSSETSSSAKGSTVEGDDEPPKKKKKIKKTKIIPEPLFFEETNKPPTTQTKEKSSSPTETVAAAPKPKLSKNKQYTVDVLSNFRCLDLEGFLEDLEDQNNVSSNQCSNVILWLAI